MSEEIQCNSLNIVMNSDNTVSLSSTGNDPMIMNLQNIIDITKFYKKELTFSIEYETDTIGTMNLFYTTIKGEDYSHQKIMSESLDKNSGTVYFKIPITEFTKIGISIPNSSTVKLKSFTINSEFYNLVSYGYDGPYKNKFNQTYSFLPYLHNYNLNLLPYIWAKYDEKKIC